MIRAAVLHKPNTLLEVMEFELPPLRADDLRVRIVASGVCHSDWHIVKGEWPMEELPGILGHEGAGVIEAVGADIQDVKVGITGGDGGSRHPFLETQLWKLRSLPKGPPSSMQHGTRRGYGTAAPWHQFPDA